MKKISLKAIIISAIISLIIIVGVIVAIILLNNKEEDYRTIKVYKIDGSSEVYRGNSGSNINPYVDMRLENNDKVSTLDNSFLYLQLDSDKYLLSEPNTKFDLVASGNEANAKTKISLVEGSITIHVTEKLTELQEFLVNAGNTTMAIRGTSFRVSIIKENGVYKTILEVFEGKIEVKYNNEIVEVNKDSTYIFEENDKESYEAIDYYDLKVETLEFLNFGIDEGNILSASKEEIEEIISIKTKLYNVKFMYNDEVFASLDNIIYGCTINIPLLKPTLNGHWDYDFANSVKSDLEIKWIEE